MYCHDLEVMSSNPSLVELGVLSTSVLSRTWSKDIIMYYYTDRKDTKDQLALLAMCTRIGKLLLVSIIGHNMISIRYSQ